MKILKWFSFLTFLVDGLNLADIKNHGKNKIIRLEIRLEISQN